MVSAGAGGIAPLFVPADRPERFAKAAGSGADAVIIDLEDAVAPTAKGAARAALATPGVLPGAATVFVRVNAAGTPWHDDDLAALSGLPIAGIVLPKAEAPAQIAGIVEACPGSDVVALVETARGIEGAREIARTPGVVRLAFGSIDFAADIGASHVREALLAARAELVLASRLGGLAPPVDGVTTSIDDAAEIEDDARYAASLGFGGKLCIHPRQIGPVRSGFLPSEAEIAWARRILGAAGDGAVSVDGTMVDAPVRARARQIAEQAGIAEQK